MNKFGSRGGASITPLGSANILFDGKYNFIAKLSKYILLKKYFVMLFVRLAHIWGSGLSRENEIITPVALLGCLLSTATVAGLHPIMSIPTGIYQKRNGFSFQTFTKCFLKYHKRLLKTFWREQVKYLFGETFSGIHSLISLVLSSGSH